MLVDLDEAELALIRDALDSHLYWQLSEEVHRDDGYVFPPVSADAEARTEALRTDTLMRKLGETYFEENERVLIEQGRARQP